MPRIYTNPKTKPHAYIPRKKFHDFLLKVVKFWIENSGSLDNEGILSWVSSHVISRGVANVDFNLLPIDELIEGELICVVTRKSVAKLLLDFLEKVSNIITSFNSNFCRTICPCSSLVFSFCDDIFCFVVCGEENEACTKVVLDI